jgi:hypothetical protein
MAWGDADQATVTPALALLDSIFAILWRSIPDTASAQAGKA